MPCELTDLKTADLNAFIEKELKKLVWTGELPEYFAKYRRILVEWFLEWFDR